jgi:hypothetical protein
VPPVFEAYARIFHPAVRPLKAATSAQVAAAMAVVLARHTTSPAGCWFGVDSTVHDDAGPAVRVGGIGYLLVRGPVELAATNFASEPVEQSAHLWWPDDRAWFVATSIDLMTTYVGGSAACIGDLLTDPSLEAAAVSRDQPVTWDADGINPLPPDAPR